MTDVRLLSRPDPRKELARLRTKGLNFDPEKDGPFTRQRGWRIDEYRQPLPAEPAGPPVPGGTWEIARRLSEEYEFVDPKLLRAYYDPREPLADRTILLVVRFYGLRIYAGVRCGGVIDSVTGDGSRVQVSAWSYRTLEDHFEAGQIVYEVRKWLDSGEVEFRIDAFSRSRPISGRVLRFGFGLFGRSTQVAFARRACARMAALTKAVERGGRAPGPPPPVAPDLAIRPQIGS